MVLQMFEFVWQLSALLLSHLGLILGLYGRQPWWWAVIGITAMQRGGLLTQPLLSWAHRLTLHKPQLSTPSDCARGALCPLGNALADRGVY